MNKSFLNRRSFLASACAGGLATSFAPSISFAQSATDQRFVFVLLRGAMDGLHAVVPYGDPAYASARGQLAYDRSVLTPLDSTFALAPGLSPSSNHRTRRVTASTLVPQLPRTTNAASPSRCSSSVPSWRSMTDASAPGAGQRSTRCRDDPALT